ncbi:hypothetical protein EUGRSUZ_E04090 [Eucalyptus grandis]|uniref:Uncharacterized protein n=2 Tax=Eucalyptus grandis TaxID=71139 RepID=A0ACC3L2E6_EUCGR|nr:hypothetical protein EUGRSUZ_E04090 [Eucalyptus grandis]
MAATGPVAVGTRGTIASLVRKEVEYFHGLERESSSPAREQVSGRDSGTSFGFLRIAWGRKKRKGAGAFRPSICSVARVEDSHRTNGNREFNYTLLEDELGNVNI